MKVGLKDATLLQLRWGLTTQKTHFNHLQWHGNRSFVAFVSLSFSPPHTACFACWFVLKADVREGILPGSFILGNSAPLEVHLLSKLILSWHSYHCKSSRVFRGCWCTFNRWNRLLSLFVESLNWKYHTIGVWGGHSISHFEGQLQHFTCCKMFEDYQIECFWCKAVCTTACTKPQSLGWI